MIAIEPKLCHFNWLKPQQEFWSLQLINEPYFDTQFLWSTIQYSTNVLDTLFIKETAPPLFSHFDWFSLQVCLDEPVFHYGHIESNTVFTIAGWKRFISHRSPSWCAHLWHSLVVGNGIKFLWAAHLKRKSFREESYSTWSSLMMNQSVEWTLFFIEKRTVDYQTFVETLKMLASFCINQRTISRRREELAHHLNLCG